MEKYVFYKNIVVAVIKGNEFTVDEAAARTSGMPSSWVSAIQRLLINSLPEGVRYDSLAVHAKNNGVHPSKPIQLIPYIDELPALFSIGENRRVVPETDELRQYTPLPDNISHEVPIESRIPVAFFDPESNLRASASPSFSGYQDKFVVNAVMEDKRLILSLPQNNERGNCILKPTNPQFPSMPRNEWACMQLAAYAGFTVPRTFLFQQSSSDDLFINEFYTHLLVERFDMQIIEGQPKKLAVAEAASFLGLTSKTKNATSTEDMFYSLRPFLSGENMSSLALMYFFGVCIGNNDMHTKNFSLFTDAANQRHRLTPVYDMVSVLGLTDEFPNRLALTLNDSCNPPFAEIIDFLTRFADIGQMRSVAESIQEHLESVVARAYKGDSLLLKNTRERFLFEIYDNTNKILDEIGHYRKTGTSKMNIPVFL